jgi:phage shock protein A
MPLIHRFTQLFAADLNAVLDRIEEPDILLRHAVREMETELASMHLRARNLQQEHERSSAREQSEHELLTNLDLELDICFAAGKDELARNLVRRKLEAVKRAGALADRRTSADKARVELERGIDESRGKLAAMREKLDILVDEPATAGPGATAEVSVAAEEIEIALLREKQRRVQS